MEVNQSYPKMIYKTKEVRKIVYSYEEEQALIKEWELTTPDVIEPTKTEDVVKVEDAPAAETYPEHMAQWESKKEKAEKIKKKVK